MLGRFLPVVTTLLCVGCFPTIEGQTAGLTGCRESELVITDEDATISTESWIATCRDRRYVCSRTTMGPTAYSAACTPEDQNKKTATPAAQRTTASAEKPASTTPASTVSTGAGGFHFGQTRDEAQQACTDGHLEFTATDKGGARCSGLLSKLGYKAAAQFGFCEEAVCKIALVLDTTAPTAELIKSFHSLSSALTKKYGEPAAEQTRLPADCAGAKADECMKGGEIVLTRGWAWPTVGVQLVLNQPEGAAQPRFVVLYSQKKQAGPNSDAL